jgi:DNA-binding beta-propeller fold protein YncE
MCRRRAWNAALVIASLTAIGAIGCAPQSDAAVADEAGTAGDTRNSYHEWPSGPYQVVEGWPKPLPDDRHSHAGWTWGSFGGVFAESPDRIWVAMRGELPLPEGTAPWTPYAALNPTRGNSNANTDGLTATCEPAPLRGWERRFEHVLYVIDGQGNLVQEWPQWDSLFSRTRCGRGPHTIKMSPYDPDKHVWVIDDQQHVIYRFTYDGQLEKTLGTLGERGRGPNNFDRPTDIAWLPDGTYFITDGYGGKRVAKFDKDDNFLLDWGQAPADPANPGPSEFNTPHSIAISADRRLFVLDRGHERMQVFDENGKFLDMWPLRSPHWPADQTTLMVNHMITTDGFIWVGDAPTSQLMKFDLDGNYLYSWGVAGPQPGRLSCSHGITTDQAGNLYLADCFAGRVQKFAPLPTADPSHLVGQINRYTGP